MGLFDRLSRVARSNLNDMISNAEDPVKVLEQAVIDMQEDLVQLRQAVARAIATQKSTEQKYNQYSSEANNWAERAKQALSKGDEALAREALVRKKSAADNAAMLKQQLDDQVTQTETLKRNLIALENKIAEAKTKKDMLKARVKAADANKQLQTTIGNLGTGSAMSTFERMEERVLMIEAESQSIEELAGTGLEQQFAQLEAGTGVDDELAMLKKAISEEVLPPPIKENKESKPKAPVKQLNINQELIRINQELANLKFNLQSAIKVRARIEKDLLEIDKYLQDAMSAFQILEQKYQIISKPTPTAKKSGVDSELEELRKQLKDM